LGTFLGINNNNKGKEYPIFQKDVEKPTKLDKGTLVVEQQVESGGEQT